MIKMIFNKTSIDGVFIIDHEPHEDSRGYFARVFCVNELKNAGIDMSAVQINTSHNHKKYTLRGLHSQLPPREEIKIIRCVRGAIFDVAVDVRQGSPTYGKYVSAELTPENGKMLLVPKGFAHGYMTLCDNTDVLYFVSEFYAPGSEKGYRYDDPLFNIKWPAAENMTISEKDLSWPYIGR
jgi:dTDP-4-dehydrorhamnose 3,5-epimerase